MNEYVSDEPEGSPFLVALKINVFVYLLEKNNKETYTYQKLNIYITGETE